MLVIQSKQVEAHNPLGQLYIGVLTTLPISFKKPMPKNQFQQAP